MGSILLIFVFAFVTVVIWQSINNNCKKSQNGIVKSMDPTDRDDSPYFDDWDENL